MCAAVPRSLRKVGHTDEDFSVCLCLRRACAHYHRVLLPHGPEAEERPNVVRLEGEGSQLAPDHAVGGGRGGRVCGLLDAHSHLHPGQSSRHRAGNHRHHGRLLLLRGSGLHQQQPQSCPLRLSG